jgi:hypothetical protein
MPVSITPDSVTLVQAARVLCCSRQNVYDIIRQDQLEAQYLPHLHRWAVPRAALEQYLGRPLTGGEWQEATRHKASRCTREHFGTTIPAELLAQAKQLASQRGWTLSLLVEHALTAYLEGKEESRGL